MSDSGVICQLLSGGDGETRWITRVGGLLVAHSKYWHDSYTRIRGDRIDVVSKGSAGAFFVLSDAETGRSIRRVKVK